MSLFDDLLNQTKPAQPVAQVSPTPAADPLITTTPITITESTPLTPMTPDITILPDATPVEQVIPTPVTPAAIIETITEEPYEPSPISSTSESIDTNLAPVPTPMPIDTPMSGLFDGPMTISEEVVGETESKTFTNTSEFIEYAIEGVDTLIADLDAANESKLAEEKKYREQKEHYAELELQAETEHKKMLEERAHAEAMKTYLEQEQKGATVATAPVSETKEKETKPKKSETKAANEGILNLAA